MFIHPLRRRFGTALLLMLAASLSLRADTTLRYKFTWKAGGMIPPELLALAKAKAESTVPALPAGYTLRFKETKERADVGLGPEILDSSRRQITLLDPAHHRYATTSMPDYLAQLGTLMKGVPPTMRQAAAAMHFGVETHKTGRTETILGIESEETDITLTVTLDLPDPSGAHPAALEGSILRVEVQNWMASASASPRAGSLAPIENFHKMFYEALPKEPILAELPAPLRESLESVFDQLSQSGAVSLRSHVVFYAPMLAGILQAARNAEAASGSPSMSSLAGMDPSAPVGEFTSEAVELSDAPLDDSFFSVPSDYQAEPLVELMKALLPTAPKRAGIPGPGRAGAPGLAGTPLPEVPKLNPSQPLAAGQLTWLRSYAGQSSQAAIHDTRFPALLQSITPDATYHMGMDMPLAAAVDGVLHGPAYPVETFAGGRLLLSTRRATSARGKALVWSDPQHGIAIGGLLLFFGPNRPSPELTLFSTQIGARVTRMAQLPSAFVDDLRQWSAEKGAPATPAVFFINHQGEESVVMHAPRPCQGADTSLCEAINGDAAETDLQAVLYLAEQRFPKGSEAAAALAAEQDRWVKSRANTCAAPPRGESSIACRTRLTRQRAEALSQLNAHPPGN